MLNRLTRGLIKWQKEHQEVTRHRTSLQAEALKQHIVKLWDLDLQPLEDHKQVNKQPNELMDVQLEN